MENSIGILKAGAKALPFSFGYIFFALHLFSLHLGGVFTWLPIFAAYIVINGIDMLVKTKPTRYTDQEREVLGTSKIFRYVTYPFMPVLAFVVIYTVYQVSFRSFSVFELIGITLSTALLTGAMGITIAHELVHRDNKLELFFADVILIFTCYMHFSIEHVAGHHKKIGTPEDNATARFGESIYQFLMRSITGSYLGALEIENRRLKKRGSSVYSWRNRMIWYTAIPMLTILTLGLLWGISAAVFFMAQAFIGFLYLEVINYVEHYGLVRTLLPSGRYERVNDWHSWNSDHVVSNLFLIKLPTHSDHHVNAHKRFHLLETPQDCPQLPFGYPTMLPIALFPKLWRSIMDPLVHEARRRKMLYEQKMGS